MLPVAHIPHSGSYSGIVHSTRCLLTSSCITLTTDFVVGYIPDCLLDQKKVPALPHMPHATPRQPRSVFSPLTSMPPNHSEQSKTQAL